MTKPKSKSKGEKKPKKKRSVPVVEEAQIDYYGEEEDIEYMTEIERVKFSNEDKILAIDPNRITGVSVEASDKGKDEIVVFVRDAAIAKKVPKKLEGYPVRAVVTGDIDAQ